MTDTNQVKFSLDEDIQSSGESPQTLDQLNDLHDKFLESVGQESTQNEAEKFLTSEVNEDHSESQPEVEQERFSVEPPKKKQKRQTLAERKMANMLQKHEAEVLRLREENEVLRQNSIQNAESAIENKMDSLKSKITAVERALFMAKEEGDAETEAKAQSLLTKLLIQQDRINQQKEHFVYQKEYSDNYAVDPLPSYNYYGDDSYSEPEEPSNPVHSQWLDANPWADPYSNQFDEGMYKVADSIAVVLNTKYEKAGRLDMIGKPEYYRELNREISNTYGGQPSSRNYANSRGPRVSPSSGGGSYYGNSMQSQKGVKLSNFELEHAKSFADRTNMPLQEVIKSFEKEKINLQRNPLKNPMQTGKVYL